MTRNHRVRATIAALASALVVGVGALPIAAHASNVAWSVSIGGPGFAVTAGQPAFGSPFIGPPVVGAPWRPAFRPRFAARPIVAPAPVVYRPWVVPAPVAVRPWVVPAPVAVRAWVVPAPIVVAPRPVAVVAPPLRPGYY